MLLPPQLLADGDDAVVAAALPPDRDGAAIGFGECSIPLRIDLTDPSPILFEIVINHQFLFY